MDTSLLLVEKVATSTAIGLLIGLEREWAHKEPGVRSFTIATLLGTLAWIVSPALAFVAESVWVPGPFLVAQRLVGLSAVRQSPTFCARNSSVIKELRLPWLPQTWYWPISP